MRRPFVVGICGGVGSGKSTAAGTFVRLGARVLDADRIAHDVLGEPPVREAIRARFGDDVMLGDDVDRKALAARVFGAAAGQDDARAALERIVHPRILDRMEAALESMRSASAPPPVVIIDAPLLTESERLRKACDVIVFVDAPEADRLARTAAARHWDADHHRARERAQGGIERKRAAATIVIENRGPVQDLERACEALYRRWTVPR